MKASTQRKLRTREQVIADLAINHVERQVLLCGFTIERFVHDYGVDLSMVTYDVRGEVENGQVLLQVKATERVQRLARRQVLTFRVERAHLQSWLAELLPIILIVYDVSGEVAYWLHVQNYFRNRSEFNLFQAGRTVTVHLPLVQVRTPEAVRHFASLRDEVDARYSLR